MQRLMCPVCGRLIGVPAAPIGAPVKCPHCQIITPITPNMMVSEPSTMGQAALHPPPISGRQPAFADEDDIPVAVVVQSPTAPPPPPPPLPPAPAAPPPFWEQPVAPPRSGSYSSARKRPPARRVNNESRTFAVVTAILLLLGVGALAYILLSQPSGPPQYGPMAYRPTPTQETARTRATRVAGEKVTPAGPDHLEPGETTVKPVGPHLTPAPRPTVAVVPTVAPEPENLELTFASGTTEQDRHEMPGDSSRIFVLGQLRNDGAKTVQSVPIICRFYDETGKQLPDAEGNLQANVTVEWLAPGKTVANFMIPWPLSAGTKIKTHKLSLGTTIYAPGKYVDLPLKGQRIRPTDSDTGFQGVVEGSVGNNTDKIVGEVQVIVLLRDNYGQVLRKLTAPPPGGAKIAPRQYVPFKLPYNGSTSEPNFTNPAVDLGQTEFRAIGKVE